MDALDKVLKPKTKRAKRFLEKREPKLSENIKNAMLIKGGNANATVTQVLRDVLSTEAKDLGSPVAELQMTVTC